jgi:hypothetical protein
VSPETIERLLGSYPRSGSPLPEPYRDLYLEHIRRSRTGANWLLGIVNGLEGWMHRRVAAAARPAEEVLEIGAGTLNHVAFEPEAAAYDAVEPIEGLWRGSAHLPRLRAVYGALADVPEAARYDRIFSIAVLEHVRDLPRLVASAALRLHPDGLFQAAIPSEGGLLWGLSWRLSTGIAFRLRYHLTYAPIMRYEHVNSAREITDLLRWLFQSVRILQFPAPALHLSFYRYLECRGPDRSRCESLLQES